MSLLRFDLLGDRHTRIPFPLAEPQMVGVNVLLDIILDGPSPLRDILLGEELLILIVVELIVADRTDDWHFVFSEQGPVIALKLLGWRERVLPS